MRAVGITLERDVLTHIQASPYYGIVVDEATDITVTKQLGIGITYITSSGNVVVKNLKLLEIAVEQLM